ncbi:PAS domain-containing hybrid sensor histidine kinase/response regulator [Flavobacterium humidisoli]|uniref:histidine kinase n=1 Tax=Flavobacterium humidisoli TaxID=2937442 RepID=A0ABY4LXT3_9FLAO|nr:PAS domain-containing hybrid sensor histidine kinase/response regulator [Flavobacterium humidisoli]UPZ17888.1 PAS domain S-box protein [Flavobacterium humidisoli]
MDIHKLLRNQLNNIVPSDLQEDPSIQSFIKAVNGSYWSFEKEKGSKSPALKETEKVYNEMLGKQEYGNKVKQQSSLNLCKCSGDADQDYLPVNREKKNDLPFNAKYIDRQIAHCKAEIKEKETVQFLKTLLENLQSGILVVDSNNNILYLNQYLCDMQNINSYPDLMTGKNIDGYINHTQVLFKDGASYGNRIIEVMSHKKSVAHEMLETVDSRFFERDYTPIFAENECIGHLWKFTDVTESIKDKNLLKQSEERKSIIINSSFHAIVTVNINGRITFWNNQAEVIFGWKKEEVLEKKLDEIIIPEKHGDGHKQRLRYFKDAGKGFILNRQIEFRAINNNGREFPAEISIIPLEQNGEVFFCCFIKDISEQKKTEIKLKVQEEKYRNILANMNLGLIEVDNNEIIQFANQSFADMSGFEINELIGLNASKTFLFAEGIERLNSKIELRKKGISDVYQIPVKNKKGELRWWAVGGAPNYDDKGRLVGSIGIHLDITEQKRMEAELEKERLKAEEASKAKEAFLANMSHEIRTPLNGIIGFLRELKRQNLTPLQRQYVERSALASKHLLSIISDVLDISKIEAGEMSLETEDFIFENVISNVVNVLDPLAKKKSLELIIEISKDVHSVLKGDIVRLQQILFNLVGNSLKFTSKGQILLKCEVLRNAESWQRLQISVTDSGIGMDQGYAKKIFNKFSQENIAISRKFGGTGLGMAITKELIHLMNGEINVKTEKGTGTTVSFVVDLEKGDVQGIKKIKNEIDVDISGLNVLLVEDNGINRMVANNSLRHFNCLVTEAVNGIEAIEILKTKSFDVILMDLQMPEMDGIEATKKIRKDLKLQTPIIAFTANAFKSEIDKCKKAGMDDYITKPYEEFDLIETICMNIKNSNFVNNSMGEKEKRNDF